MMPSCRAFLAAFVLVAGAAQAQQPKPAGMSFAEAASHRFPQPVRAGDLVGRTVLQPLESQPVLGHVDRIVRLGDGMLRAVVAYGGVFGIGARPIAVPLDAMVLLGQEMEIIDLTPQQLDALPRYDGAGATPVSPDEVIRVGLARPSH